MRRVLQEETGLTPEKITRIGTMEHIWPETHTVTIFHRVDVADNTVTMNDEHSDYKWVNSTRRRPPPPTANDPGIKNLPTIMTTMHQPLIKGREAP